MVITCIKWCKMVINGFSHLKVVNSFTTVYNVLLRINTYPPRQIWQVQAHAQLLVAVGPSPLLHICASLRRGRTRTWSRPWYRTPSRRAVVGGIEEREGGGGLSSWACWLDTFWLGRWLLLQQPPPLPLFPTHPSRTWTRPAGLAVAGRRPSYPSRIRVESLSNLRTLPHHNLPGTVLPLRFSFKFLSNFVTPQLHWQVQVCDRGLSFWVPLFSRLWHVSFKFVIASLPSSIILASSARWPSVESSRDAAGVCRAAPEAPCLARLPSWTMLVAPAVSAPIGR